MAAPDKVERRRDVDSGAAFWISFPAFRPPSRIDLRADWPWAGIRSQKHRGTSEASAWIRGWWFRCPTCWWVLSSQSPNSNVPGEGDRGVGVRGRFVNSMPQQMFDRTQFRESTGSMAKTAEEV